MYISIWRHVRAWRNFPNRSSGCWVRASQRSKALWGSNSRLRWPTSEIPSTAHREGRHVLHSCIIYFIFISRLLAGGRFRGSFFPINTLPHHDHKIYFCRKIRFSPKSRSRTFPLAFSYAVLLWRVKRSFSHYFFETGSEGVGRPWTSLGARIMGRGRPKCIWRMCFKTDLTKLKNDVKMPPAALWKSLT